MLPANAAELLRHSILIGWAVLIVGAYILRLNSAKLSDRMLKFIAYLGYVNPSDLRGPGTSKPAPEVPANQKSKSLAV
jgi:hypothetical protein